MHRHPQALDAFFRQNGDLDLNTDNLARPQVADGLNWEGHDRAVLLPQLQAYQRLLRLHPDPEVAGVLLAQGFRSAHQIAATAQSVFAAQVAPALERVGKGGAPLAAALWHASRTVCAQVNRLALAARPETDGMAALRHQMEAVDFETALPSYRALFGPQPFCECDECRSVWGPAAYFTDLMRLIDKYITLPSAGTIPAGLSLRERRPDLWDLELSCANTYHEQPYLQLANRIMAQKLAYDLGEAVEPYLATHSFPFSLPLNLPEAEIRAYLQHFDLTLAQVYQRFQADAVQVARVSLGLSTNRHQLLTTSSAADLATVYGLYDDEAATDLEQVSLFLRKTGLTPPELDELLYQGCHLYGRGSTTVGGLAFDPAQNQQGLVTSTDALSGAMAGNQTIVCWVKADALGGDIIHKDYWREGSIVCSTDGGYHYRFGPGSSMSHYQEYTLQSDLRLGVWLHVAFVRDMDRKVVYGYVDGLRTEPDPLQYDTVGQDSSPLLFGEGNNGYFAGALARVSIWSRVLDGVEIRQAMHEGLPSDRSGLVGYWPLSEGAGATAHDQSGNAYDAALSGSPGLPAWVSATIRTTRNDEYDGALLHRLFVNQLLPAGTFLDAPTADAKKGTLPRLRVIGTEGEAPAAPSPETFDRLQRFIRLARSMGWGFGDLDWALQALGAADLDDAAVEGLAGVKQLCDRFSLPVDEAVALFHAVKTYGKGDDVRSQTLFDRTFNQPDVFFRPDSRPTLPYHPAYAGNPLFTDPVLVWDALPEPGGQPPADTDAQIRSRLLAALQLTDADLTSLVRFLDTHGLWSAAGLAEGTQPSARALYLTVDNLGLLYRYSRLARCLKLPLAQLLGLLPHLPGLPATYIEGVADVVRICDAVAAVRRSGLTPAQIDYLLSPGAAPPPLQKRLGQQADRLQAQLRGAAAAVLVQPGNLVTPLTSQARAAAFYRSLVAQHFIDPAGVVLAVRPIHLPDLAAALDVPLYVEPDGSTLVSTIDVGMLPPPGGDGAAGAYAPVGDDVAVWERTGARQNPELQHVAGVLRRQKAAQDQLAEQALAGSAGVSTALAAAAARLAERQLASCLTFDGDQQQTVTVPWKPSLNPDDITVSMWVRFDTIYDEDGSFVPQTLYSTEGGATGFCFGTSYHGDAPTFHLYCDGHDVWAPWEVQAGVWYHVLVSIAGGDDFYCFIDGAQVAHRTLAGAYVPAPEGKHTFLASHGYDAFLYGALADVRLYGTAIQDPRQVLQEMNSPAPLPALRHQLAAWWPMNARDSTTLYDWSRQQNHGTVESALDGGALPGWNDYTLRLLLAPSVRPAAVADVDALLQAAVRMLCWTQWNRLSAQEALLVAANPRPFGVPAMRYGFQPGFADLMAVALYKRQCAAFKGPGVAYLHYFDLPGDPAGTDAAAQARRQALADLAGWDVGQLGTLIAQFAYGDDPVNPSPNSTDFDTVAGVEALVACFDVSERLGVSIDVPLGLRSLSDASVTGDDDTWAAYTSAAAALRQSIELHYGPGDVEAALAPARGQIETLARDLMGRLLIWELGARYAGIETLQDLYEFLLVDVKTSSTVQISPLKLGLNALQLYVQRCMTNLENGAVCQIPKAWWSWMSDYRTWQANREVYLYPENYVDPTLRKLASPLFDDLVTQVKQSPVSPQSATQAYLTYLNGLKDVANLRIVDSCAYDVPPFPGSDGAPGKRMLTLFGRTASDPATYYYRHALVPYATDTDVSALTESSISWSPWEKLDVNIPSDYVTPVFAFGKLFVFWATQQQASSTYDGTSYPYVTATIYYSFQKAGAGWIQPQVLASDLVIKVMDANGEPLLFFEQDTLPGFDPRSAYEKTVPWQKPGATRLPATEEEPEKILVTLGNLVCAGTLSTETAAAATTPEQKKAKKGIEVAYQTASDVRPNLTTVLPGITLTAGLETERVYPVLDAANMAGIEGFVRAHDEARALALARFTPILLGDAQARLPFIYETSSLVVQDRQYDRRATRYGSASNATVTGPHGEVITAIQYDGSTRFQELDPGSSSILIPSVFTFGAWIYSENTPDPNGWGAIFDCRSMGSDSNGISLYYHDGGVYVELPYGNWQYNQAPRIAIENETWYYVLATSDGVHTSLTVFDTQGARVGDVSNNTRAYTPSTAGRLRIGAGHTETSAGFFYKGYIVEPTFWDFALPLGGGGAGLTNPARVALGHVPRTTSFPEPVKNQPGWFTLNAGRERFLALPRRVFPSVDSVLQAAYDGDRVTLSFAAPVDDEAEIPAYQFVRLSTGVVDAMLEKVFAGGLPALLRPESQYLVEPDFDDYQPNPDLVSPPSAMMDFSGAYGTYFWELFYHIPVFMGNTLQLDQQFAEAAKWYAVVFDPTAAARKLEGLIGFWPLTMNSIREGADGQYRLGDLQGRNALAWQNTYAAPWATQPHTTNRFAPGRTYLAFTNQTSTWWKADAPLAPTDAFTVEAWLSIGASIADEQQCRFLGQQNAADPVPSGFRLVVKPATNADYPFVINMEGVDTDDVESYQSNLVPVGTDTWFHVAMTWDRQTGRMTLFINGVRMPVTTYLTNVDPSPNACFCIGAVEGFGYPHTHLLANVALWDHVRTEDQIRQDMALLRYSDGETPLSEQQYYLLFRPFATPDVRSTYDVLVNEPQQVLLYEYDPFDPDAIAQLRPSAYKKAIVLQYIANLIAYGDYLFTQDTWESINAATLAYVTAANLLGRPSAPRREDRSRMDRTYAELETAYGPGQVPAFLIDLEAELPPVSSAGSAGEGLRLALEQRYSLLHAYFCIPSNTRLAGYRKTIEDRLYKIRHGLTITGQPNDMPLFEPPLNPETMVQAAGSGAGTSSSAASNPTIPYYRFSYVLQVARNVASQVVQLGGELLAALEKQDAEHLSTLRETQANAVLALTTQIKQDQVNQLYAQQSSLQANLQAAQTQQQTYQTWIDESWNEYERIQFALLGSGIAFSTESAVYTAISSPMYLVPNIFGLADGGMNFGGMWEALGRFAGELSGIMGQSAQITGMNGSFERTNDDWNLQVQLARNSVAGIQAQLQAVQYEIDAAKQDYEINQTQIQQSNDVINFLQTKFTSEQLYQWMVGQLSTIYFQAYNVAVDLALMAQAAFQYELSTDQAYVNTATWNSLYKGLLAGEGLAQSLQQLERAYLQGNSRALEIEKTISLLQLAPEQLVQLRQKGTCTFSLTEKLFDLDFPGHYNRKITSVALTLPAVVGPYQNVHATLTQTGNRVITSANVQAVGYLLGLNPAPAAGVVRTNWNANQAIAISTGTNDSGLFQLNFNDERYLFFEGTGAVSDWQLDLPKASNPFNFESISDVIITLRYTAYDGGRDFRNAVLDLNDGKGTYPLQQYTGTKYVSVRQFYGNAWHQFLQTQTMTLELVRAMFPLHLGDLCVDLMSASAVPVVAPSEDADAIRLAPAGPEGYDPSAPFAGGPVAVTISATFDEGSGFLLPDGHINPEKWRDLLLMIPFTGTLDWGT